MEKYNNFSEYGKSLGCILLDDVTISDLIQSFWSRIFNKEENCKHYMYLYIVIEYQGGVFKSLGKASLVNIRDLESYKTKMIMFFDLKDDFYHQYRATAIILNYKLSEELLQLDSSDNVVNDLTVIHEPENEEVVNVQHTEIKGYNLPANTNIFSWGRIIDNSSKWVLIEYTSRGSIYHLLVEHGYPLRRAQCNNNDTE